jgi:hypothetical protein
VCDILAKGLIGLIGYSYQQVATYFLGTHSKGTLGEACLAQSNLGMGARRGSCSRVRTSEEKSAQKRQVLVCGDNLEILERTKVRTSEDKSA